MVPFPFFIKLEKKFDTIAPTISNNIDRYETGVPFRISKHVLENNLYFGLDLDTTKNKKIK